LRIFSRALCLSDRTKAPRGVGVIFSRGMARSINHYFTPCGARHSGYAPARASARAGRFNHASGW
jgi:hypothetical protein